MFSFICIILFFTMRVSPVQNKKTVTELCNV